MDLLSGHENDVNYVQFSGCAVASRSFSVDTTHTIKEENNLKLRNSWSVFYSYLWSACSLYMFIVLMSLASSVILPIVQIVPFWFQRFHFS